VNEITSVGATNANQRKNGLLLVCSIAKKVSWMTTRLGRQRLPKQHQRSKEQIHYNTQTLISGWGLKKEKFPFIMMATKTPKQERCINSL